MSQLELKDCINCQEILNHWIEFQLVDEEGKPLVGMPYKLVSISNKKDIRTGVTNGEGLLREEGLPPTPVRLWVDSQKLADEMELRPLRTVREPLGSKVRYNANTQRHYYRYIKIGNLCDKAPKIDKWNKKELPKHHFPDNKFLGFKAAFVDARWVLEICPFRAWVLLLHHQKEYSLVNAYNQGLMSVLPYADAEKSNDNYEGSVFHFFKEQLLDLSKLPNQVDQQKFYPIVYDVPFKDRYTEINAIDTGGDLDTQMFYASNNKELIVGWRGTASATDVLTDAAFKPINLPEIYLKTKGKVHEGFYRSFLAAGTTLISENALDELVNENTLNQDTGKIKLMHHINNLAEGKKLFICGHSLGGALALIHSVHLRKSNPCLYTYGMPRVFTYNAIVDINDIVHYRHINKNDPVPTLPFEKNMDNALFKKGWDSLGYLLEGILTVGSNFSVAIEMTGHLHNEMKSDEIYLHQGEVVHFYEGDILPLDLYVGSKNVITDLYLLPTLIPEDLKNAQFFPQNKLPKTVNSTNALGGRYHPSGKYMEFMQKRLLELCVPKFNELYKKDIQRFKIALEARKGTLKNEYFMYEYFLRLDEKLEPCLSLSKENEKGKRALDYFIYQHSR
ncbi:lipase family protein [Xenorhabdus bovienii]|uniref:lipase family protein n=1 Tax=Xenorhabdus bovienii TaxID=40576 RepID=UPI0023B27C4A|nr:lipase family protein [Xenorhabdus bovienii]MDE9565160.1 lipase family protein [Xenorhabdus bovienii]